MRINLQRQAAAALLAVFCLLLLCKPALPLTESEISSVSSQAETIGAEYNCPYNINNDFIVGNIGYSFHDDEQAYSMAKLLENKSCFGPNTKKYVIAYVSTLNFPSDGVPAGEGNLTEERWLLYWNYSISRFSALGYKLIILPSPFILNEYPVIDTPPGLTLLKKSMLNIAPGEVPAVYECRDGSKSVIASIYDPKTLDMAKTFYSAVNDYFSNFPAFEKISIVPPSDFGEYGFPFGVQGAWWNSSDSLSDCYLTGDSYALALISSDPPSYDDYNGILNRFMQNITDYVKSEIPSKRYMIYLGYGNDDSARDGFSYEKAVNFSVNNSIDIHSSHGYGAIVSDIPLDKISINKPGNYTFTLENAGYVNEYLALKNNYNAFKYNVTGMELYPEFLYDHLFILPMLYSIGNLSSGSLYSSKSMNFTDRNGIGSFRSNHLASSYIDQPANGTTINGDISNNIFGWGYYEAPYGDHKNYRVLVYAGPLINDSQYPGDTSCNETTIGNCNYGYHPEYMRLVGNTTTTSERSEGNGDTSRFGLSWKPNLAKGKVVMRIFIVNNDSGIMSEMHDSPLIININSSVSGDFILTRNNYTYNTDDQSASCTNSFTVAGRIINGTDMSTPYSGADIVVIDEYSGRYISAGVTNGTGAFSITFNSTPQPNTTDYSQIRVYAYIDTDNDGIKDLVALPRNISSLYANIGYYNNLGNKFFTTLNCSWCSGRAESCNGIDDNCNGVIDEGCDEPSEGGETHYNNGYSNSASSQLSGYGYNLSIDGDDTTSWCANTTASGGVSMFGETFDDWWQVDFETPRTIGSLYMQSGLYLNTLLGHKIRDFVWAYQQNGSSEWTKINETDFYANRYQLIFRFDPITNIKKMRLLSRPRDPYETTLAVAENNPCLREVSFYPEKNAVIETQPWIYGVSALENSNIFQITLYEDQFASFLENLAGKQYADIGDVLWIGEFNDYPIKAINGSADDYSDARRAFIKYSGQSYQIINVSAIPVSSTYASWILHEPAPAGFVMSGSYLNYNVSSAAILSGFYRFMNVNYMNFPILDICGSHQMAAMALSNDEYSGFADEFKPYPDSSGQVVVTCGTIYPSQPSCRESGMWKVVPNIPSLAINNSYSGNRSDMLFDLLNVPGGFKAIYGHTDCVNPERISSRFDIIGTYPNSVTNLSPDNFCLGETIKLRGYPVYGTQFHPDFWKKASCTSPYFFDMEAARNMDRILKNFYSIALNSLKPDNINSVNASSTRTGSTQDLYDLDRNTMWCSSNQTPSLIFDLKNSTTLKYIIDVEGNTTDSSRASSYDFAYSSDGVSWNSVSLSRESAYSLQDEKELPSETCYCDSGGDSIPGADDDQTMVLKLDNAVTARYFKMTINGPTGGSCMREIMFLRLGDFEGRTTIMNLLSPNGTTSNQTPTFEWGPVSGATSYEVWVDNISDPHTSLNNYNTQINSTNYTFSSLVLQNNKSYEWWLRYSIGNSYSSWSEPIVFNINTEICNNQDDDSDGLIDEGCDDDNDTFWDSTLTCSGSYKAGNNVTYSCLSAWADLDDTNPSIGKEICNNQDDDSDGIIDDGCDNDNDTFWDGSMTCSVSYRAGNNVTYECRPEWADSDDTNASIHYQEICNNRDDDGDGIRDDGCDEDKDGFWNSQMSCSGQYLGGDCIIHECTSGLADCNDNNASIHAGATEVCNGIDDDCDGSIDEGGVCPTVSYYCDNDQDGYNSTSSSSCNTYNCMPAGCTITQGNDCNDNNASIHPGTTEVCNNIDDDCDSLTDENLTNLTGNQNGSCSGNNVYCSAGSWITNSSNHNITNETCNGADDDCDNTIDENLSNLTANQNGICQGNNAYCNAGNWITNSSNHNATNETCNNIDDDCDGTTDENITNMTSNQYGRCNGNKQYCSAGNWIANTTNYNITNETCNNIDDDCDGTTDENITNMTSNQYGRCNGNKQYCSAGNWIANTTNYNITNETCNNQDDDCDNSIDENLSNLTANQNGTCQGNNAYCSAGSWITNSSNHNATNETCNGLDDDCDGSTDENLTNSSTNILGMCINNTRYCNAGTWYNNSNNHNISTETCNNQDDNCNGQTDEGLINLTANQNGTCQGNNAYCSAGSWITNSSNHNATNETCNGLDDDCDGTTDENLTNLTSNQNGSCSGNNIYCSAGNWITNSSNHNATNETCNGIDDDCDGTTDENLTNLTANQNGTCQGNNAYCSAGAWITNNSNHNATNETCNNIDDDCDGNTDENLTNSSNNILGLCINNTRYCSTGTWYNNSNNHNISTETCNNQDDDCDGSTDENLSLSCYSGTAGTSGIGVCHNGTQTCSAGNWSSCAGEINPTAEINDGLDNDCDNSIDEGFNDSDHDGVPDVNDTIIGTLNDTSTNFENLSLLIDGVSANSSNGSRHVEFVADNTTILEFDFNFSSASLNLSNITIEKQDNDSAYGSIIIKGINLTGNESKTVRMNRVDNSANRVCVLDEEIVNITQISSDCSGTNETSIKCDGSTQSDYTCELNESSNIYTITGLRHSGVIEYEYTNTSSPPTGGAGGGGGGSGGAASNPAGFSKFWNSLQKGITTVNISNENYYITSIIFSIKESVTSAKLTIEKLAEKPSNITIPQGKILSYLMISFQNASSGNINSSAKIRFKLLKTLLSNKSLAESSIALKRFNGGSWDDLPTALMSSDNKYSYYESESNGFSYFAIGEKNTVAPTVNSLNSTAATYPEKTDNLSSQISINNSIASNETIENNPIPKNKPTTKLPLTIIIIPLAAIVILSGTIIYLKKKINVSKAKKTVLAQKNNPKKELMIRPNLTVPYADVLHVEEFIESNHKKGVRDDEIRKELISVGWHESLVDIIMHDVHVIDDNHRKLQKFIKNELRKKVSIEKIRSTLLNVGWREDIIDLAIEGL